MSNESHVYPNSITWEGIEDIAKKAKHPADETRAPGDPWGFTADGESYVGFPQGTPDSWENKTYRKQAGGKIWEEVTNKPIIASVQGRLS